jgi:hypothetical protein
MGEIEQSGGIILPRRKRKGESFCESSGAKRSFELNGNPHSYPARRWKR